MRTTCRRRESGRAIREAMSSRGLSLPKLSEKTKELDPDGRGVSYQLIGFLVATGSSARESTSPRAASLISQALGYPENSLFDRGVIGNAESSTEQEKVLSVR